MAEIVLFNTIMFFAVFALHSTLDRVNCAQFQDPRNDAVYYFPFGSVVNLSCVQNNITNIEVFTQEEASIKIVRHSLLQKGFSNKYNFEILNSTSTRFTIKNLTVQINDTIFICQNPKQFLVRVLGFNPIKDTDPLCSLSYGSRFIFEDEVGLQSDNEMICTSEEGDPPVRMSTYISDGDEFKDVTSISTRTVSSYPYLSKTLSSYFNSSFNNSVFVCNVSQQLPEPYQSYQGSCSFGPILFLPLFSVTVTPSTIDFSDVRNAVLRCTSNVSEVNLSWTKIPTHWKYDNKGSDASIELTVLDTGRGLYSGDIQCIGYSGDRNMTSMIQISATNNPGTDVSYRDRNITSKMDNNDRDDLGRDISVALVITAISLCLIFVMIVIVVLYYRLNESFCNRNPDLAKQNSSTNNANVRNTTITDEVVSSMGSHAENSALDVPAMIDNTIYETYTEKDCQNQTLSEIERLEKEQEIEMVENEIYESNSFSGYE